LYLIPDQRVPWIKEASANSIVSPQKDNYSGVTLVPRVPRGSCSLVLWDLVTKGRLGL
jgi:hypothetical protein